MNPKPLTFLLALTFLFLFSGSSVVFADDFQDGVDAYKRQDYKTAYKLFLPLAEQGQIFSRAKLYDLAVKEVPQALRFLKNDARQGHSESQNKLGELYSTGIAHQKNYIKAHMWFNLAGSKGNKTAIYNRNSLEKKMSPEQIEKAQEKARNWIPNKSSLLEFLILFGSLFIIIWVVCGGLIYFICTYLEPHIRLYIVFLMGDSR